MKTQSILFLSTASTLFTTTVLASDPFSSTTIEKLRNKLKTDKYKNNVGEVYSNSNLLSLVHCPPWKDAELQLAYVDGSYRSPLFKNQKPCDWEVNFATCIKDVNSVQYAFHVMGRSPEYANVICATIFIETDKGKGHWHKDDTLALGEPQVVFPKKVGGKIELSSKQVQDHPRWRSVQTGIKKEDIKLTPKEALVAAKAKHVQLMAPGTDFGFEKLAIEKLSLEVQNAMPVYIFKSFLANTQLTIMVGAKDGSIDVKYGDHEEAHVIPVRVEEKENEPVAGPSGVSKEEKEQMKIAQESSLDTEYDTHRSPGLHLSGAKAIMPSQDREVFKSPSMEN